LTGYSGSLDDLLDRVEEAAPESPAARCGFDGAIHGLQAQLKGLSVARLLGATPPLTLPANTVIGSQETGETLRVARDAVARGFRTLKLKVGGQSDQEDLARIEAVRHTLDAMKPDLRLRIDANGAWHAPEALQILRQIAPLRIELVEQPVPAQDLEGLARVHAESPIPVAADESLAHQTGRQAALDGKICSLAVLKPMVLGGLRACARFSAAARECTVRCYVTTTFEGGVGTALAAHLAAAIADPELACGLASDEVLDADFPPELIPREGRLRIREKPGLGWRPEP
jgi:L-alanine-DL-glutamate epimerase-like enolase superfamily enzyme